MSKNHSTVYRVTSIYNPTGFKPGRVYPLFQTDPFSRNSPYFAQVLNSDGRIAEFRQVRGIKYGHLLKISNSVSPILIGYKGVFGIVNAEGRACLHSGIEEFNQYLKEHVQIEEIGETPFFGLEVARYVGNEELEETFACGAVSALLKVSVDIAKSWTSNAPISDRAREAVRSLLEKHQNMNAGFESKNSVSVLQTHKFAKKYQIKIPGYFRTQSFSTFTSLMLAYKRIEPIAVIMTWDDYDTDHFREFIEMINSGVKVFVAVPFAMTGETRGWWTAFPIKLISSMNSEEIASKIIEELNLLEESFQ